MALANWTSTDPTGSENASDIDLEIRNLKDDIEERMRLGGHAPVEGDAIPWGHRVLAVGGRFSITDAAGAADVLRVEALASGGAHDGIAERRFAALYIPGILTAGQHAAIIELPYVGLITKVRAVVGIAPSVSNLTIMVDKDPTAVLPAVTDLLSANLTITTGNNKAETTGFASGIDAVAIGDNLQVTIVSADGVVSDLTLTVEYTQFEKGF